MSITSIPRYTRRTFLAGTAAVGAAAALSLSQAHADEAAAEAEATDEAVAEEAETEEETDWKVAPEAPSADEIVETYDCDVLVIGLGHAGCCALRAAAENGASVAAFVNQAEDSMSYLAGGQVGHINSQFLGDQGVPQVNTIEFINDWQVRSNNRSNPGLVRNYATHCGECFDWLIDCLTDDEKAEMSIRQWPTDGITNTAYSGVKCWIGTANLGNYQSTVLNNCISVAVENGGQVFYSTSGYLLIQDEDGTVTGAYGKRDDGYVQVNATNTILATGDFSTNSAMTADLLNEINWLLPEGGSISASMGRDGKGIQLGYWAGGRIDPCQGTMDGVYWYPCDSPTDTLGATSALWINADGYRYSNEGFGSTELEAMPGSYQPSGIISCVFDSNVEEMLMAQPLGHMSYDYSSGFDSLLETLDSAYASYQAGEFDTATEEESDDESASGGDKAQMSGATLYAADTLEELGGYLGYEGDALEAFVASVERYNELCESGIDLDFGKDPALLFPVATPPFYGYCGEKELGVLMVTTSGLVVDQYSRVLGDDYRPVGGLYAAGNTSGCRFGYCYFTSIAGQSLSFAQTQGMMAGIHAATGELPEGTYVLD